MTGHRAPAGLAQSGLAPALASLALGCTFPAVTFGDLPADGGTQPVPGVEASVADSAFYGGDDAPTIPDAPGAIEGSATVEAGIPDSAPEGGASCDFNGWWANRITIDVTWQPQGVNSVIIQPGSGTITQWVLGKRVQSPAAPMALSDDSVVCGISLPDFQAFGLTEVYGVRFPTTLFDDGYIPPFKVNGALTVQPAGVVKYDTTATAVLIGLTMTNPTTDPWPAMVSPSAQDDMDHDENPGVTVAVAQGPLAMPTAIAPSYSYIPTGIPVLLVPPPRASSLYLAIRQVTSASGAVQDCNTITGTVSIQTIQSKPAIDSHILGCALVDGGSCASSQASFLDNTQPVFAPSTSGTTTFQSIRMSKCATATCTCADVRAAAFK